jgi:hypothetical protein
MIREWLCEGDACHFAFDVNCANVHFGGHKISIYIPLRRISSENKCHSEPLLEPSKFTRKTFGIPWQSASISFWSEYPVALDILRNLILAKYQEFSQTSVMTTGHPKIDFKCTRHFLTNVMKWNKLSYRCTRAARRPAIDRVEVEGNCAEPAELHGNIFWDSRLNADESFWLILEMLRKTIASTGVENVKVSVDGDPTAGLTLMGMIPAAGTQSSLFLMQLVFTKGLQPCHRLRRMSRPSPRHMPRASVTGSSRSPKEGPGI